MDTTASGFPGWDGGSGAGGAWGQAHFARQIVSRRARLPVRLGVLSALLVGVVPIVAILVAAVVVGGLVYAVASAAGKLLGLLGLGRPPGPAMPNPAPPDDGRENVRVMGR
ncbi:MAG: hypothetical protein AAF916_08340 [Planctomycetota bacterium]